MIWLVLPQRVHGQNNLGRNCAAQSKIRTGKESCGYLYESHQDVRVAFVLWWLLVWLWESLTLLGKMVSAGNVSVEAVDCTVYNQFLYDVFVYDPKRPSHHRTYASCPVRSKYGSSAPSTRTGPVYPNMEHHSINEHRYPHIQAWSITPSSSTGTRTWKHEDTLHQFHHRAQE
jgi:hypothetical protein